jgi:CDP-diacylglycerol--serine O-phosphatidyltransferase
MIIGKWNKSVILTYLGLLCSVCGIILALNGVNTKYVLVLLMSAGICDLFDGAVARKIKRDSEEKKFGIQIDSLVDVINFLVFPVIYLYSVVGFSVVFMICAFLFILFGIVRLAYFNIKADEDKPVKYYQGLPVTYSAMIFPFAFALKFIIPTIFEYVLMGIMFLTSILFILNIPVRKPGKIAYIVFFVLYIAMFITFLIVL